MKFNLDRKNCSLVALGCKKTLVWKGCGSYPKLWSAIGPFGEKTQWNVQCIMSLGGFIKPMVVLLWSFGDGKLWHRICWSVDNVICSWHLLADRPTLGLPLPCLERPVRQPNPLKTGFIVLFGKILLNYDLQLESLLHDLQLETFWIMLKIQRISPRISLQNGVWTRWSTSPNIHRPKLYGWILDSNDLDGFRWI